jgi:hypothetical protein
MEPAMGIFGKKSCNSEEAGEQERHHVDESLVPPVDIQRLVTPGEGFPEVSYADRDKRTLRFVWIYLIVVRQLKFTLNRGAGYDVLPKLHGSDTH